MEMVSGCSWRVVREGFGRYTLTNFGYWIVGLVISLYNAYITYIVVSCRFPLQCLSLSVLFVM